MLEMVVIETSEAFEYYTLFFFSLFICLLFDNAKQYICML